MTEFSEASTGLYRIVKVIHEGRTATVYEAEDRLMDRTVAVKILNPHFVRARRQCNCSGTMRKR